MTVLIDDQLLSVVLRGDRLPHPLVTDGEIYTTGYWYVRLCQAVLGVAERRGTLSGPLAQLPSDRRARALAAVMELPDDIGLLSLRTLGPVIGQLRARHQLNILSTEALAAAMRLDAVVALSARSPRLEASLLDEGCQFVIVG